VYREQSMLCPIGVHFPGGCQAHAARGGVDVTFGGVDLKTSEADQLGRVAAKHAYV
jgi:hypothetical protein